MKVHRIFAGLAFPIIALFVVSSAPAQSVTQFGKGNQDYASGRFQEAIEDYESLVQSHVWSPNLFYNLGNAYFRTGDFGHAILNYERALALDPRHPEADANLRIARDEARALELVPGNLERMLAFANSNQYGVTAAIAFWIGIFLVFAWMFAQKKSKSLLPLSILSFLIFVASVFAIYTLSGGETGRAIVTGENVEARIATADNANSVLALPAGSEIRIVSSRGDWIYAALPNNLRGWMPAKSAEQVRL
jgi:tetratricopeptide (TPR) repeat protein